MINNEKPQDEKQTSTSGEYIPSSSVGGTQKSNLAVSEKLLRLLFMLFFVLCHYIIRLIVYVLAIAQFLVVLVTSKPHEGLRKFGQALSYYAYQILQFLTYNTEEKPFPFSPWPQDRF
ncbi:MAG: putative lipase [Gammaproteobacteria bacterium]|nr:putative lipase [Gammaproteobacteria bacterium]